MTTAGRHEAGPIPSDQDASGRLLGEEEIAALAEAVRSGTLTSTKGRFVAAFETAFAQTLSSAHAVACASGTSAIHAAIAAIDPSPGDEIVTSPVTDMGAITPILYQTAIPVFADVDPLTGNVTAESIARVLGPRTRAIIVTHLFGNPAEMGAIAELAGRHAIPLIEDCAQAYGARYAGRPIGTIGALGCFSLQQGKHITTGEGGVVVTDDPHLARRVRLFVNKAWGYGDAEPDHYFAALNGRMSELQGAVATAQLAKLETGIARRQASAAGLRAHVERIEGVDWIPSPEGASHGYWRVALRVGKGVGGPDGLAAPLLREGIACAPRYVKKPAFACAVIRDQRTFGDSRFPFTLARPEVLDYARANYRGTHTFLEGVLVLAWNERLEEAHVAWIGERLAAAAQRPRAEAAA